MIINVAIIIAITVSSGHAAYLSKALVTRYKWNLMEYEWPSVKERQQAILNGTYMPDNPFPIDVDVVYIGKLYLNNYYIPGLKFVSI